MNMPISELTCYSRCRSDGHQREGWRVVGAVVPYYCYLLRLGGRCTICIHTLIELLSGALMLTRYLVLSA